MQAFQNIIRRWPSRTALAEDMGVALHVVHHWHHRNSIPAKYDGKLLEAASQRGIALGWRELTNARATHHDDQIGNSGFGVQGAKPKKRGVA